MEIIEYLAKNRTVEAMVEKISHRKLNYDLQDLCQMVYVILLEYPDDKIVKMHENKQTDFFIAKIIVNQLKRWRDSSQYYKEILQFQKLTEEMGTLQDKDIVTDGRFT